MIDRYGLLQRGLFPEILPPCFTSVDIKRALVGLVRDLNAKAFNKRPTDYIPYNGTKHDGNRRYFASPNPIPYFYVASFIAQQWATFEQRFSSSPFSVSQPRLAPTEADRPIVIPSLSELTTIASHKLRYSAHILKTDIAQFFPSIYTHTISWSAHGIDAAKADTNDRSNTILFNQLDFFVRNCQRGETRGVMVGPDAFRLIAEFIAAGIDAEVNQQIGNLVIGAARHVDDYYIGVASQPEALAALSVLRDALQRYHLNINDTKTRIMPGIEPLNELWAQRLRHEARKLGKHSNEEDLVLFLTESLVQAAEVHSDSPVKIAIRTMDEIRVYLNDSIWDKLEPYLQRILHHHPHCIDYVVLLVVKRSALRRRLDKEGWKGAAYQLIERHLLLNHHHEVVWLTWMLLSLKIDIEDRLSAALSNNPNAHILALLVAGHVEGLITRKPNVRLGPKLATTESNWLVNLVARATGYSGAPFSGLLTAEFDHLANKKIKLINFKSPLQLAAKHSSRAISRTRYGYDGTDAADDEDDSDMELPNLDDDLDAQFEERIRRDNT